MSKLAIPVKYLFEIAEIAERAGASESTIVTIVTFLNSPPIPVPENITLPALRESASLHNGT